NSRSPNRGHEAEYDAGRQRHCARERQHAPVKTNFARSRERIRTESDEGRSAPCGQQHADTAGENREQYAFSQKLPQEMIPSRAQRGAESNLALTWSRLRE